MSKKNQKIKEQETVEPLGDIKIDSARGKSSPPKGNHQPEPVNMRTWFNPFVF